MDAASVIGSLDLNGPTITGIRAVSDVGLSSSEKLPLGTTMPDHPPSNDQYIQEQAKRVGMSVIAALTIARNRWLAYGEATTTEATTPHANANTLVEYLASLKEVNLNIGIVVGIGSKLRFWQSNHHTRTGGHRIGADDLEGITAKLWGVAGEHFGNVKSFLDATWLIGHLS
eukprot:732968-Amphidinium_carterae.1